LRTPTLGKLCRRCKWFLSQKVFYLIFKEYMSVIVEQDPDLYNHMLLHQHLLRRLTQCGTSCTLGGLAVAV
jgi:hypothetical protein